MLAHLGIISTEGGIIYVHTSLTIASVSFSVRYVQPRHIAVRKAEPGGSKCGLVQYTPVTPSWLCPPKAYSRSPTTTPECRRPAPTVQRKLER
jgi:hypothetical protein